MNQIAIDMLRVRLLFEEISDKYLRLSTTGDNII